MKTIWLLLYHDFFRRKKFILHVTRNFRTFNSNIIFVDVEMNSMYENRRMPRVRSNSSAVMVRASTWLPIVVSTRECHNCRIEDNGVPPGSDYGRQ